MKRFLLFGIALLLAVSNYGQNHENKSNLANKIQNPIANLISVPFQNNIDFNVGPFERTRNVLNIQPVIPFKLNENINLITRTIFPIVTQPVGLNNSTTGLGDTNLTLFLTSAKPKKVITGYGLAFGIPTATDAVLGSEKWTVGPSFVALKQSNGWTIGGLIQNTWSYAGSDVRGDVNLLYSQIFLTKNLQKGWYVNSAPIITANWEASSGNQWTVPLGAGVGRLVTLGKLPINSQIGYYYNVVSPDGGASSQLRFQIVLLFPQ